jgi:transcriptional regulator with XRE-family HTH domain
MAKTKVRPHPGVLGQSLKERNMTQEEAAKACGIDRKTLAKINRGQEVKLETLQKVATKLKVPITYFDPPANSSVGAGKSINQFPKDQVIADAWDEAHGFVSLLLRKVDLFELSEMLCIIESERIEWKLNVRTVDDETISLLEQFEDAVKDLCEHINKFGGGLSLRGELAELKKSRRVANLMEELATHGLAVLGNEWVSWQREENFDEERNVLFVNYQASLHVMLSIEGLPAHERRLKVLQGEVPPRFAPPPSSNPWHTVVTVDGRELKTAPATIPKTHDQALKEAKDTVEPLKKHSNPDATSEDNNAK